LTDKTLLLQKQLHKSAETDKINKQKELDELEKNPPENEPLQIQAEITDEDTDSNTSNARKYAFYALAGGGALVVWSMFNKYKASNT